MATLAYGPRYGLLDNAAIGQQYYDALRLFCQSIDSLIYASSINTTQVVPPSSPNPGDTYLLLSAPSGVWAAYQGYLAYWNSQNTNSGTNTLNPSWLFIAPKAGVMVYDQASALFYLYASGAWTAVSNSITLPLAVNGGGTGATTASAARTNLNAAASGTNVDITSLGGIFGVSLSDSNLTIGDSVVGGESVGSNTLLASLGVVTPILQTVKQGSGTTIAAGTGAGTGATATLATRSTDMAGEFTIVMGTGSSANARIATITFGTAYSSANYFISSANASQTSANLPIYFTDKTTTTVDIYTSGDSPSDNISYTYSYHIIQGQV